MSFPPRAEVAPPFSVSPASSTQLEASLAQAILCQSASMERLHAAVDACVADLHRTGMSPEAVLVTMKALLRHTAADYPPSASASRRAADMFMEDVVRWTILAYFRLEALPG